MNRHIIKEVEKNSIAEEMELKPGDVLLEVNGEKIEDIFDYQYLIDDEYIEVLIEKPDGEQWELEIEKEYNEDLGIIFENGLMDNYRSCANNCIFCFIDQMPEGMRDTLYFKDDDSRLSFLQGNYVTLTNMSDKDIDRIIKYKLNPINISFQTTNPDLRCKMLNNKNAGKALEKADRLFEAGIEMNGQIVLCKKYNDGEELDKSILDLTKYLPLLKSVSIVPVGLTRFRNGLTELEPFTKEDAIKLIEMIERWQKKIFKEHGTHFIHASDEWYILADQELPKEESYDGYLQLENGVGMLRLLMDEFDAALIEGKGDNREVEVSAATGELAYKYMLEMVNTLRKKYPNVNVKFNKIQNKYFGERITVAGLITGQDIIEQLKGKDLGKKLLIPCNMLKSDEDIFLDDITVDEVEKALQVRVDIVKSSGKDLLDAMISEGEIL